MTGPKIVLVNRTVAWVLGVIVAADVRLTRGEELVCWEKEILLVRPIGVVTENEYVLPVEPAGTVSTISLGEIEVIFKGRFLVPVMNANLL